MTDAPFERPCAEFATCAAEPCDHDAVTELLHSPADDYPTCLYVQLCPEHRAAASRGERIEYVVECHGFVPALTGDSEGGSNAPTL